MVKYPYYGDELIGKKIGMLTIVRESEYRHDKDGKYYECKCDCGNTVLARASRLRRGITISCGCQKWRAQHGMNNTRIYKIWCDMKYRCTNSHGRLASYYRDRGITLCEEWETFAPFYKWAIENGYSDSLTIDRINNDQGYSPSNCRWATYKEQNANQRKRSKKAQ